ncbi:hypothetical protein FCM35_KLT10818 [Carex littledalei]|uniref:Uncharacterized protein n=1 Tax=Carex littledalei TaxID=544730 RepID=A0A833QMK6_9POAL|nr:hypothetical protein FCM35_KLT10818 [Carex littledalei]
MDIYNNLKHHTTKSSAPQGKRASFPLGIFQKKWKPGDPNPNSNHIMTNTNTDWTESTDTGCEPQPDQPTINTSGGWVRPTRAGWALPADKPLEDDDAAGLGQTMAAPKMKPVRSGLFKKKNSTINSRDAAKKYGGQFIFK